MRPPVAFTLALVAAAIPAAAQPSPGIVTTGAFFALSVAVLDASARWYAEKLGLKVVMHVPKTDKVAVTVLEGGGLIVELVQQEDAVPLSRAAPAVQDRVSVHGLFKAGMIVEHFDKTVALLRSRGVEMAYGPYPASKDQRANVIIRDNAGNLIQIFGSPASSPSPP
ncbi:MAG TPA: VOC family protein [Gemmatimonadales bacterium]|nr:VOC family protein [Gemmatimonadales bacterium]